MRSASTEVIRARARRGIEDRQEHQFRRDGTIKGLVPTLQTANPRPLIGFPLLARVSSHRLFSRPSALRHFSTHDRDINGGDTSRPRCGDPLLPHETETAA